MESYGPSSTTYRRFPYCGCYVNVDSSLRFLPRLKVDAHTTILSTTSRTTLTQLFINPHKDKVIDELRYDFPLYDGVSVVGFTCTVADRVITGVVKEREKARQEYTEAKDRGDTAGLLEQSLDAADVFTTSIGMVPAGEKVKVEITYLGELKHDAEVDGVRFTIPTIIAPRYGLTHSLRSKSANWYKHEGISITVDAEMPDGSAIKSVQSPSHPLSVHIGTTSTAAASEEPSLRKASATLSQGSAELNKDFIVHVVATKIGEPSAFVETHPTIPNQRAIMATVVPKFKLPAQKPEIVFLCDRSGSMTANITDLIAALNIFLKSLPLGVKFNICSFGSHYSFLWPKSKTYSQESVDRAVRHVKTFAADYGGTEMYEPFKAAFEQRYKDMNLEVFLLTDGAIWDQDRLFSLVNEKVAESKGAVRVFSLGVGSGASTALIEGVARAGNGFAQTVGNGEKMDKKVIRMLKGALFPHITDYRLEIKYEKEKLNEETKESEEDDFEVVEKVLDSLSIQTAVEEEEADQRMEKEKEGEKQSISLFDPNIDDDGDNQMPDAPAAVDIKYDHLPKIETPRYLQTPSEIPALYPFSRTTVYVLLSDSTPDRKIKSVLLKGTSKQGPLVLEIPVVNLTEKSTTIHQLAARKEVKELEEGRGWLAFARDADGTLFREKHEGYFPDMVEKEAVRLGVKFQVGGKWCSFVAVEESNHGDEKNTEKELDEFAVLNAQNILNRDFGSRPGNRSASGFGSSHPPPPPPSGTLFGGGGGSLTFGSPPPPPVAEACAAMPDPGLMAQYQAEMSAAACMALPDEDSDDERSGVEVKKKETGKRDREWGYARSSGRRSTSKNASPFAPTSPRIDTSNPLQALTALQTFVGSWSWSITLQTVLGVTSKAASRLTLPDIVANHADKDVIVATACAVVFFKKKLEAEREAWEMLVDKAEAWLDDQVGESREDLENAIGSLY
ncbi:von Willebrand factor type A domain-containing protein [Mariannaea sp. PMI_226]|nr:von Willebrand factor type A domain-containing protein [Mariannaea sp. PMI_226]